MVGTVLCVIASKEISSIAGFLDNPITALPITPRNHSKSSRKARKIGTKKFGEPNTAQQSNHETSSQLLNSREKEGEGEGFHPG